MSPLGVGASSATVRVGLKHMQIGGSIRRMDSIAEGAVQTPSPQIRLEANVPANSSHSLRFSLSHMNRITVPTNMSMVKYALM